VHDDAIADLRGILQGKPEPDFEATVRNNLAWYLVTGPTERRDANEAVTLSARAAQLASDRPTFANTLGVAHYRLGRFDEAVTHLRRSLRESKPPVYDLFFLAMCFQGLGNVAAARDYYDQAEYWMREHARTLSSHMRSELEAIQQESRLVGLR